MSRRLGPWRRPRNISADAAGSIHDDATAVDHGFRGGTVAGNVHLNQPVPMLLDAFGNEWFETGSLALWFRHATVDGEAVRVALDHRPDGRAEITIETGDDATVVADGTATVGAPDTDGALHRRDLRPVDPSSLRLLGAFRVGDALPPRPSTVTMAHQQRLLDAGFVTEPLGWYSGPSPWGGPVACPLTVVDLMTVVEADLWLRITEPAVGMYGAIGVQFVAGPVLLDVTYEVSATIVALSESPKTEVLWYDAVAHRDGMEVVRMRMMSRLLKPRSP